jgi:hypothetical protein
MVKVADALHEAGYDVHVVSARMLDWATRADESLRLTRSWSWQVVDYARSSAPATAVWTGARHRAATIAARVAPAASLPWGIATRGFSRIAPELVRAVAGSGADAYFGGTSGGLSVVHDASCETGRPFGVDLEDLHTSEREDEGGDLHHQLAERVERVVLPGAKLVTTSSEGIASAYRDLYGVDPVVVHNVWPLPRVPPPMPMRVGPLKFYWFSQTIGPQRGLEETLRAIGVASVDATVTLRGRPLARYPLDLERLVARVAPRVTIAFERPVAPDALPASCEPFDVGISSELPRVRNRSLALSNKLFMYMTGGLAILATTVASHRALLDGWGDHVAWVDPDAPEGVAPVLTRWALDRTALHAARQVSWAAARDRWHWEHPLERGRFLERFAQAFG